MNHVRMAHKRICYSCDPCDYETTKKEKHNRHVRMTHEKKVSTHVASVTTRLRTKRSMWGQSMNKFRILEVNVKLRIHNILFSSHPIGEE